MTPYSILRFYRARGIKFDLINGRVHFRAPKGALGQFDRALLRTNKASLIPALDIDIIKNMAAIAKRFAGHCADLKGRGPNDRLTGDRINVLNELLGHWKVDEDIYRASTGFGGCLKEAGCNPLGPTCHACLRKRRSARQSHDDHGEY